MRCETCNQPLSQWEAAIEKQQRFPLCNECKGVDYSPEAEYLMEEICHDER